MKFLKIDFNKKIKKNTKNYTNLYLVYNTYLNLNNFLLIKNTNQLTFKYNSLKGNFNKNAIITHSVFAYIYKLFYNNHNYLDNLNYKYTKEFLYNFFKYNNYNNFNFILSWVFSWIKPIFFMDCVVVPKKYRKKLKKKYLYKVKYLNVNSRLNKSLRLIKNYKNSLKYYSSFNRELFTYLDLILNYKYSYIFLKKINIYKKVFKI